MTTYIQTVLTEPKAGAGTEFNDWYSGIHLPEMLQIPGVVAGQRFAAIGHEQPHYLTIYELDTEDIAGTVDTIAKTAFTPSDAIDQTRTVVTLYEPVGARRER